MWSLLPVAGHRTCPACGLILWSVETVDGGRKTIHVDPQRAEFDVDGTIVWATAADCIAAPSARRGA